MNLLKSPFPAKPFKCFWVKTALAPQEFDLIFKLDRSTENFTAVVRFHQERSPFKDFFQTV